MKKILMMVFGLFLLLPVSSAFAYGDGYLSTGQYSYTYKATTWASRIFDKDPTTYATLDPGMNVATVTITLNKAISMRAYKASHLSVNNRPEYKFYNSAGKLLKDADPSTSGKLINLSLNDVKKIEIYTISNSVRVYEFEIYEQIPFELLPVTNLEETHTHDAVTLNWTNPNVAEFIGATIKRDGVILTQLSSASNSYTINELHSGTAYSFEVVAKYNDNTYSKPEFINVTTDSEPVKPPEPTKPKEITDLKITATHERVDLSWDLPKTNNFKHVNIYRNTIKEIALIDRLLGVQTAYAAETKIFETNGTYFNDLTVSPSTTYEYTLSTTSIDLVESGGITKRVTTLAKPKTTIGGGGYTKDEETGDYTYYWTSPSTGLVKILVGGTEYKKVYASDLKVVIPKEKMKFTLLGSPDVRLVPIDEDGTEGTPSKPPEGGGGSTGDVKLPFGPIEIVKGAFDLLKLFGPYILIALSILLLPRLINIIKGILQKNKERNKEATR